MCEFLTIPGGHRELCVGICFSLGGFLLVEASEKNRKSPPMRSWYEVVWYVDVLGVEKALFEHPTDCCGFSFPRLWTRFLGFKAFIRHSFHKVPSRMVSIAIVILTILSPLASNPPNFFPPPTSNQLTGPRVGWGWKPPHLNTIRSKARSPLTSRKAK